MISSFDLEAARRLPLAEAALRLLHRATDDDFLNGVFERHRGRSYEGTITFPLFVRLISDALLGHRGGSAHQTFLHARADQSLGATVQAAYGKLGRVPLDLSLGLFAESAARLREVAPAPVANPLPAALGAFWALGLDGKKLKYVAKKLKPLRALKGNIFGGKLLVVQDMATQHAVAAQAVADGEAADNPLVPGAVERVRAVPGTRPRLWVGDRAFCDLKLLGLMSAGADQFVVRHNSSCGFRADPGVPARTGTDDENRPYREEWGWLGAPNHRHRARVRKITVARAGDDPLALVTSLDDADRYPAFDLLKLYRSRWGIETMFQRVVQTFELRHLIGGTPQATVFQAVLCLLLYNITLLIRDYVAVPAEREPRAVSLDLLFGDVRRELTGWMTVLGADAGVAVLRQRALHEPEDLRRHLAETLATVWVDRWTKAPARKRPPPRPPRAYICGGHTSVDKILRGAHHEIALTPSKKPKRNTNKNPPPFETKKDV
jgi:hypothetical protein